MLNLYACLAGLVACWLLFRRLPFVGAHAGGHTVADISIVIPARDEAHSLPLLLADIAEQSLTPTEIIVVDDESTDETASLAEKAGARLVRVRHKPAGWTGKTYACTLGARAATGRQLLFLDADVRLRPGALAALAGEYEGPDTAVSVQPYHTPQKWYEQLSLFFNLIAVAALGERLPGKPTPGLFGPVILLDRETYFAVGGHEAVRRDVVEDLELGKRLAKAGCECKRRLGGSEIRFRMYPGGPRSLTQGYIKNFATGAAGTRAIAFVLVFLWLAALIRVPLQLGGLLAGGSPGTWVLSYLGLYLMLVAALYWAAHKVGGFKPAAIVLYPVSLGFFLGVFLVSVYKKLLGRPVVWKGRSIEAPRGR